MSSDLIPVRHRFSYRVAESGRYLLEVASLLGKGGPDCGYQLRVLTAGPAPQATSEPTWTERHFTRKIDADWTDRLRSRTVLQEQPHSQGRETATGAGSLAVSPDATPSATDRTSQGLARLLEREPNELRGQALPASIGELIDGTIGAPGDRDTYTFEGEAGTQLILELATPRVGPPHFNPRVELYEDQGGSVLANVHKYGTIYNGGGIPSSFLKTVEPKMAYTLERSGRFFVEVRDVTSRYGGPDYEYRLLVRTPIPHVGAFDVDPVERINLVPGIARKLSIVTHQEEGFAGEVLFACSNLPPGVQVFPGADVEKKSSAPVSKQEESFLPGIQKTTLVLLAEPDAPVTPHARVDSDHRQTRGRRTGRRGPARLGSSADGGRTGRSGEQLRGRGLPIVVMKVRVSDWITSQWNRCGRRPGPILCSTVIVVSSVLVCAMAAFEAPAPSHSPTLLALRLVPEQAHLTGSGGCPAFRRHGDVRRWSGEGSDLGQPASNFRSRTWRRVGDAGRVVALAPGEVTLRARIGGREAQSRIRIDPGAAQRPFRFDRDIASILTKRGCNASECHGSVKGKGGLKLSLDALYPEEDHEWIVKGGIYQVLVMESGGPRVPRVNPERPEESLLLQKAAMQVIHGGGERLGADSADYAALLDWIRERGRIWRPK